MLTPSSCIWYIQEKNSYSCISYNPVGTRLRSNTVPELSVSVWRIFMTLLGHVYIWIIGTSAVEHQCHFFAVYLSPPLS